MVENLVLCMDHINQHLPKPHLVLVTGDITNTGQAEEFNHATNLLNRFEMPLLCHSRQSRRPRHTSINFWKTSLSC